MKVIKLRITGNCPLLMHSERGANPLDKAVQAHKTLTSKRKKTEDDQLAIARSEYELAFYHDGKAPFIPAINIDRCIQEGAKKNKLGRIFEASARCVEDRIPLIYNGPKDIEGLYQAGFVDIRSVGVNQSRVMRVRPMFREWALEFDYAFDETQLDIDQVLLAASLAGSMSGLGDYRPRFGRFSVEVLS